MIVIRKSKSKTRVPSESLTMFLLFKKVPSTIKTSASKKSAMMGKSNDLNN